MAVMYPVVAKNVLEESRSQLAIVASRGFRRGFQPEKKGAFTVVELLVVVAILATLAVIVTPVAQRTLRLAKRTESLNNMKYFVTADTLYFAEYGRYPEFEGIVPSTISKARLQIVADYCNLPLPEGPVSSWPRSRKELPRWIYCPITRSSGYAEGMTAGGGVYTGYLYVGGINESMMVKANLATIINPEHNAPLRGGRRGVLWASILGEFRSSDPRRYECFHYQSNKKYNDFRFHQEEVEGIHRGWSDGSVEWLPAGKIGFGEGAESGRQIDHLMGYYYY